MPEQLLSSLERPFGHGEFHTLLRAAGFVNIDVCADLTLVAEGRVDKQDATMPSAEAVAEQHSWLT